MGQTVAHDANETSARPGRYGTFPMVFLILSTQQRDAPAVHIELVALIRPVNETDEELATLKHQSVAISHGHGVPNLHQVRPGPDQSIFTASRAAQLS